MKNYTTIQEATKAAELFFFQNFGYKEGVGYEVKGNVYSFYSKNDPAMDDTFECTIG